MFVTVFFWRLTLLAWWVLTRWTSLMPSPVPGPTCMASTELLWGQSTVEHFYVSGNLETNAIEGFNMNESLEGTEILWPEIKDSRFWWIQKTNWRQHVVSAVIYFSMDSTLEKMKTGVAVYQNGNHDGKSARLCKLKEPFKALQAMGFWIGWAGLTWGGGMNMNEQMQMWIDFNLHALLSSSTDFN